MEEAEFRFKDTRPRDENLLRILRGNYALFMRRARDPNYGTKDDRAGEEHMACITRDRYFELTGETLDSR